MPITGTKTVMANLIKTKIEAITNYPDQGVSPVFVDIRILEAICEGVIEHLVANTLVNTSGKTVSTPDTINGTVLQNSTIS